MRLELASVISISPEFDDSLVRCLKDQGWPAVAKLWNELCSRHSLTGLDPTDIFLMSQPPTASNFECFQRCLDYLSDHKDDSITKVLPVLPATRNRLDCDVRFLFLPFGAVSYGPKDSLQLFSLHPNAHPYEVFLFVIHVYYHEVSRLSFTERCRRCSSNQNTSEDFKYWIKLLIRNEGIANYAVLGDLLAFADENDDYSFRYFTYARQLTDRRSLDASFRLLRNVYGGVADSNLDSFRDSMNQILKNKALSIVNIVGTHIARAVVRVHGLDALADVYKKDPDETFALFRQTDDPYNSDVDLLLADS